VSKLVISLLRVGMDLSPSLLRVGMRLSDPDLLQTAEPFIYIYYLYMTALLNSQQAQINETLFSVWVNIRGEN
jgi:hypothetical protein